MTVPLTVIADRVQETTSTTGTGTITLGGAGVQMQTFAAGIGVGNQTTFCILSGDGTNWEISRGVVGATTLTRVLNFSSTGSLLSLVGTSTVFAVAPAAAQQCFVRPNLASFTWLNQGTATATDHIGGPLTISGPSTTADNIRGLYQSIPGGTPWTCVAQIRRQSPAVNYLSAGIMLYDSVSSKILTLNYQQTGYLQVNKWTNATTFSANVVSYQWIGKEDFWMKIYNDGVNFNFYYSADFPSPYDWTLLTTVAVASWGTPNNAGFYLDFIDLGNNTGGISGGSGTGLASMVKLLNWSLG